MKSMFALVDCNNFYVSCERVFNPKLAHRPVIVLSNNDGCAVARSEEAKAIGIKMGAPAFKIRHLINAHHVAAFSSNYALYGDMSRRVMQTLSRFTDQLEIYSIDEAFLKLSGRRQNSLTDYGENICTTVFQWTGLPVSMGIAPTKTLAKIACRLAKKSALKNLRQQNHTPKNHNRTNRALELTDTSNIEKALEQIAIENVWGIGRQYATRLHKYGITTALALSRTDEQWIQKLMGINGVRTVKELQGIPCYLLENQPSPRKGVTVSRTFHTELDCFDDLKTAITAYTSRGAEKLRTQKAAANMILVFATTNRFKSHYNFYTATAHLPIPTNDTPELIHYADQCLRQIYKPGILFKKAGVIFKDIVCESPIQTGLFDTRNRKRSQSLMRSIDTINSEMGKNTIRYASTGLVPDQKWQPLSRQCSPAYTTNWNHLP
ncbi:MAG: Y-family DNA polymerase, partial [Desulfobacteraceae bacterium]|nr:Y-family DNA polymerase [Desulfobacteraceae bacterium]